MEARRRRVLGVVLVAGAAMLAWPDDAQGHPQPDAIRTAAGCRARIARQPKRGRCVACIGKGRHHFHKRGAGVGFCHKNGAAAPAAVGAAVVAADTVRTREGCARRIKDPAKREHCLNCIATGQLFQQQGKAGAGVCRKRPGPGAAAAMVAAPAVRTPAGCRSRIARLPKRRRCMACVWRRHVFQLQGAGAGLCRPPGAASVAATVAVTAVRTPAGCKKRIVAPGKRKRCLDCVSKGNIFQKQGGGVGFCRAPAPAVGISSALGCGKRIAQPDKRKRCLRCVNTGRVFFKQGFGPGACRAR